MTGAPPAGRDGPPAESSARYTDLLTQVFSHTLEEDYRTVAERRGGTDPPRRTGVRRLAMVAVLVLFGAMLIVSAIQAERARPAAAAEREQLIAQIQEHKEELAGLHDTLTALQTTVSDLRDRAAATEQTLSEINTKTTKRAIWAGMAAVSGPGVVVRTDNAPGAEGSGSSGIILDTDLQALVNSLWHAGAEAIAINGHRLTSLTAIRFAGQAITVDYRSLTPPYVVTAIGDPDTLPARLVESRGGQLWLGLEANFGIRFEITTKEHLVIPGHERVTLRHAEPGK